MAIKDKIANEGGLSDTDIDDLITRRKQAKSDKNWAECDEIRNKLQEAGIILEDTPEGTRWRRS